MVPSISFSRFILIEIKFSVADLQNKGADEAHL